MLFRSAVIKAKGEAESIVIRGEALKKNPEFVDLQIVDKWDGLAPVVIGGGDKVMLSLQDIERLKTQKSNAAAPPTQSAPAKGPIKR